MLLALFFFSIDIVRDNVLLLVKKGSFSLAVNFLSLICIIKGVCVNKAYSDSELAPHMYPGSSTFHSQSCYLCLVFSDLL